MSEMKIPVNSEVVIHQLRDMQTLKDLEMQALMTMFYTPGSVYQVTGSSNFAITQNATPPTGSITYVDIGKLNANTTGGMAITKDGHRITLNKTPEQTWVGVYNNQPSSVVATAYNPITHAWNMPRVADDPNFPVGSYAQQPPYGTPVTANNTTPPYYYKNSGNIKIPIPYGPGGTTAYFFIDYLQIVDAEAGDPSTYPKVPPDSPDTDPRVIDQNTPQVMWYSRYRDGYILYAMSSSSYPTATAVYLGSAIIDGAGAVTASYTGKDLARIGGPLVFGNLGTSTTSSYARGTGAAYSIDEHFQATGTGTVSATNPHGLSASDLGAYSANTNPFTYTISANTVLDASYGMILVDATNNDVSLTLPAASYSLWGLKIAFKRIDASTHAVYIIGTIDNLGSDIRLSPLASPPVTTPPINPTSYVTVVCGVNHVGAYQWWVID